jgi:hypothetical protein
MDLPIGPRQLSLIQLSSTYYSLVGFGRAPLLAHIERADQSSQDVRPGAAGHLRIVEQDLGFGKVRMVILVLLVRRQSYWDTERLVIRESLARQVWDVMRLAVGAASGDL